MSIKTKKYRSLKPDVLVVGIDVAKFSHVAVIRYPDGTDGWTGPFAPSMPVPLFEE